MDHLCYNTKSRRPYTITFKATDEIKVENVLLSEVWLASGQSNMEFFMAKIRNGSYTGVIDYEKEIKEANFPNIRQIDVVNKNADDNIVFAKAGLTNVIERFYFLSICAYF